MTSTTPVLAQACRGGRLDAISHLEGAVEQQRHASDQVAERLCAARPSTMDATPAPANGAVPIPRSCSAQLHVQQHGDDVDHGDQQLGYEGSRRPIDEAAVILRHCTGNGHFQQPPQGPRRRSEYGGVKNTHEKGGSTEKLLLNKLNEFPHRKVLLANLFDRESRITRRLIVAAWSLACHNQGVHGLQERRWGPRRPTRPKAAPAQRGRQRGCKIAHPEFMGSMIDNAIAAWYNIGRSDLREARTEGRKMTPTELNALVVDVLKDLSRKRSLRK